MISDRGRHGVTKLSWRFLPASGHFELFWETLQPSHLADCETPHPSLTIDNHFFSTRDTVILSLKAFARSSVQLPARPITTAR
jgi:hypothetical protein